MAEVVLERLAWVHSSSRAWCFAKIALEQIGRAVVADFQAVLEQAWPQGQNRVHHRWPIVTWTQEPGVSSLHDGGHELVPVPQVIAAW